MVLFKPTKRENRAGDGLLIFLSYSIFGMGLSLVSFLVLAAFAGPEPEFLVKAGMNNIWYFLYPPSGFLLAPFGLLFGLYRGSVYMASI